MSVLFCEIGNQRVRCTAARNHCAVDGCVVAMIATDVDAWADAHCPLWRIQGTRRLRRLGVRDAVTPQEFPGANDWTEPALQVGDNKTAELVIGEWKIA